MHSLFADIKSKEKILKKATTVIKDTAGNRYTLNEAGEKVTMDDAPAEYGFVTDLTKDDEVHQILENFYISSEDASARKDELDNHNIKAVLNVAYYSECHFPDDIEYLHLKLVDIPDQSIKQHFQEACEFIDKHIKEGNGVLVHCVYGVSRSASFVIAYIMYSMGLDFKEGLIKIREGRAAACPNPGFRRQLREWETELANREEN